ncbi:MAG: hypothetical protein K0R38_6318 [Polyangiaceae bacterium]|jgi:hypothetical protein|nr:hypothetical protein [Polyangiaceae bacterium]
MRHLSDTSEAGLLDRAPFVFEHSLTDHPALSLESLARTIPELPAHCLNHSKGLDNVALNFDRSFDEHKNGLSLMQSFERLKEVSSYITIMDPIDHPAFRDLYRDLKSDVEDLQRKAGRAPRVYEGRMWLFIASPNAITPFHFDRYSNFLMQIRGSKQMAVFPNFREEIVPARVCESYMDREPSKDLWRDDLDVHASKYDFRPGAALHIPFAGGHYVKNGAEDISVSLSFFFQTDETNRWVHAMQFNNRVHRHLGVQLSPIGKSRFRDKLKASTLNLVTATTSSLRKLRHSAV